MRLRELLEGYNENKQLTFIIAKAIKDEASPLYHFEYKTTPIRSIWEWKRGESADKYIVIKREHPPIDITGSWHNFYSRGDLLCCMVTTEEDMKLKYSEKQAMEMIRWFDEEARK